MVWQDIYTHYPQQWVLIEAIQAHSANKKRLLVQLAVVDTFDDSVTAMQRYAQLHREAPQRELYVFHKYLSESFSVLCVPTYSG